jgi:hypothetical protein
MALVQRELTGEASQIMGQARHDKIYADLPGVARLTQHPFGKFNPERWAQIRAEAASDAAQAISRGLNTTPQNVVKMMTTRKPLSNSEADKQLYARTIAKAGDYNSVELTTTVRLMDSERQIQPGTRNSELMTQFMGSPQFATGLSSYSRSLGSQTMGEYLVNPLVSGATERMFIKTREDTLGAQASITAQDRQLTQNPTSALVLQPRKRTGMILAAIPGVGTEGARGLSTFVDQYFDKAGAGLGRLESPNARFMREDAGLLAALQGAKFQDPRLEAWRKKAIGGWDEAATAQQGFITRMIDSIFGDEPDIREAEFLQNGNN